MPIFKSVLLHLFPIFVCSISILGCSKKLGGEVKQTAPIPPAVFSFKQHEIVTGSAKHQTVLTGFLMGGTIAELAMVDIDENNTRHLRIYAFSDGTWGQSLDATLHPQVLFVDIAHIDGRDRLISYQPGRLNWFDPDSAIERTLVEITTNYNTIDKGKIPHVDITQDLNGDSLDDLVVPDVDGFWIATQLENGRFTDPIKIGPPDPFLDDIALDEKSNYRDVGINSLTVLWYLSRVHQMDYNADGRNDLVFWNTDHFEVYLQNAQRMFPTEAETFTIDIPFDTDGAYSIAFGYSGENMLALIYGFRKNTKRKVLHTFRDMNGDGVADLIIHSLEGRGLGKQRSLYEVHLGMPISNGTVFAKDVSMTIKPRGTAGALQPWGYSSQWLQDFDGDGDIDILFRDVNTAIGGMTRALVGNSIAIDLEFYRMENGTYADKPTATRKIRPVLDLFKAHGVFFPAVLLGDVNGDGRSDLLVGKNWKELHIFLGVPGPELLAKKPQKVKVAMPNDERNIWLVNLNKDNKQDILIYHRSTTEQYRVTMLIAK